MSLSVVLANEEGTIKDSSSPRFLLFDLAVGGHHPSYIRYLLEHWHNEKIVGHLSIIVSPEFLEKHNDVVGLATFNSEFIAITSDETSKLSQLNGNIKRAFAEWEIYCKYATDLQVDHSLLMYFDHFQLPIVFGGKSPCSMSGIYFRPSFHYRHFDNHVFTLK
ncbi:MAG: glycosyltransferase family 1 protein, partial [Cyanobacteria bacterium J06649_11]